MGRHLTTLLGFATALALSLGVPATVHADCAGPTYSFDAGAVRRGTTIEVMGTFWGDNCHDTGPAPPGEGFLGRPLTGIEITFVQGDVDVLVARGNADEFFAFDVEVTVPAELTPGPATIVVSAGEFDGYPESGSKVKITSKSPVDTPDRDDEVVEFGPPERAVPADAEPATTEPATTTPDTAPATTEPLTTTPDTEPAGTHDTATIDTSPSDGGPGDSEDAASVAPWVVGAVLAVAAGVGITTWTRRRKP